MRIVTSFICGFICAIGCLADSNGTTKETDVDKLKQELLKNYNKLTRPEQYNTATKCNLSLTLIHMDLDETRGVLTSHAWLKMMWTDSKLSWDNNTFGMNDLHVAADEIWQPDLSVYNSAEPGIVEHYAKTNKIVYSSGNVLWVPTAKIQTYCALDLKLWPFDLQKCSIKIGSWTYSGHKLDIQPTDNVIDTTEYYQNSEWKVLRTSAIRNSKIYPCCPEPYIDITFELTIQRRSPMFKAVVVTPAIVIVFMTLVSFWLPPQAGVEKLLLNGVAAVVICMLLVYFSQLLPVLSASPPLIVTFYSHTLYLLCVSFIISVIVTNLSRNRKQYEMPHSIKANILDGFIGRALSRPSATGVENHVEELRETPFEEHRISDDHQIIQTSTKSPSTTQADWIRLAIIVDRTTFFIYIFIFIVMGFLHFI